MKIAILPGDGIGPEITNQAVDVVKALNVGAELVEAPIGGAGYEKFGDPLPDSTLDLAIKSDAILLGAVGDWKYDTLPRDKRPERGLLRIRKELNLFANLRPAILYPELVGAIHTNEKGEREGINTMRYSESEIKRIAHVAFQIAMKRSKKLCSVDKANVLETTELWRQIMIDLSKEYPEVELTHMYVDNAAMQLIKNPKQFDVLVTGNIFGDILSDEASMLTGSIGMLPSASLDSNNKGMYEPSHGSAPDIAGKNIANPLATILSVAMMFRYTFSDEKNANKIESAVKKALSQGFRTADIYSDGDKKVSCSEMGEAVIAALK